MLWSKVFFCGEAKWSSEGEKKIVLGGIVCKRLPVTYNIILWWDNFWTKYWAFEPKRKQLKNFLSGYLAQISSSGTSTLVFFRFPRNEAIMA